jgi:predicted choloylglycine hydrolase
MGTQRLIVNGKKEIRDVIKKTIRETIKEEFFKIRLELTPEISEKEMTEIKERYKAPDKNIVYSERIEV